MKILILGGSGMLGHKAYQILSKEFDTFVTFNDYNDSIKKIELFDEKKIFTNCDAFDYASIEKIITQIKPDYIFNCIGIIKQLKESKNPKITIYINSLLPHLLQDTCERTGTKLIHITTDCVFSGKKGNYVETDISDAEDLYGRTKFLGEVSYGNALTIRTSIIGHELFTNYSLVDWFLSRRNETIGGYLNAIYTGFPTVVLCREIIRIIKEFPELHGLYHISAERISKFELLNIINKVYKLNITIVGNADFYCDRSLDSNLYRKITGFQPTTWEDMIIDMYNDYSFYQKRGLK